jgi:hypothetical protein
MVIFAVRDGEYPPAYILMIGNMKRMSEQAQDILYSMDKPNSECKGHDIGLICSCSLENVHNYEGKTVFHIVMSSGEI